MHVRTQHIPEGCAAVLELGGVDAVLGAQRLARRVRVGGAHAVDDGAGAAIEIGLDDGSGDAGEEAREQATPDVLQAAAEVRLQARGLCANMEESRMESVF